MTTREQLLEAFIKLGEQHPEMRFAQLVANAAYWGKGPTKSAIWDIDDEQLLEAIDKHLQNNEIQQETDADMLQMK